MLIGAVAVVVGPVRVWWWRFGFLGVGCEEEVEMFIGVVVVGPVRVRRLHCLDVAFGLRKVRKEGEVEMVGGLMV